MSIPDPARSFDAFYRSQHVRLFHYFKRKVGRDAASDLVQEAFTRMLRSGAFERVDNPDAYLNRTARNLLIEYARSWRRKQCLHFPLDEAGDAAVRPEQDWRIDAEELRAVYRRALLSMPRRTRRIFLMHRLKAMFYREIAIAVGIGENGVEYHMMRALARCRRTVAARYG